MLFSTIALSLVYASPSEQSATAQGLPDLLSATLRDANQRDTLTDELSHLLANVFIEYLIAPHTGETTAQVEERLERDSQTAFQFLVAVLTDAREKGILPEELSDLVSELLIDRLIVPDTGETSEQATSRLTGAPASRPVSSTVLDELLTDDPPVNFRITGYSHDWIAVQWEAPRNRGITNYVLQRADHNGSAFISFPGNRIKGANIGGSSTAVSDSGDIESDARYRYTLSLKDDEGTAIINRSVEVRTPPESGPTLSSDATLNDLSLAGVQLDAEFSPHSYWYSASAASDVLDTAVSATTTDPDASHIVKLGGITDDDDVIDLREGKNVITVAVTAEDGIVTRIYTVAVTRGERTGGICDRTPEVRDAILKLLPSISDCSAVSAADLSGITGELSVTGHEDLRSLDAGDFQGLTGLSRLYIHGNALTSLPAGVFSGLSNLTHLDFSENSLTYLPRDIFAGLFDLESLKFNGNNLDSLPSSIFAGIENLDILWMHENPGSPFELSIELKARAGGAVAVEVREGAPFEVLANLSAQGGSLSSTTVVIDPGGYVQRGYRRHRERSLADYSQPGFGRVSRLRQLFWPVRRVGRTHCSIRAHIYFDIHLHPGDHANAGGRSWRTAHRRPTGELQGNRILPRLDRDCMGGPAQQGNHQLCAPESGLRRGGVNILGSQAARRSDERRCGTRAWRQRRRRA